MAPLNETTHTASMEVGFDPFTSSFINIETQAMEFNPFDILPDSCAQLVQEPPLRIIPASTLAKGNNGNNLPANIGEGLQQELAKRREGRMSGFTLERAAAIVEGFETGMTVDEIAADQGINRSTIYSYMQLSPEFSDAVARAREYQGHSSATDAVKILDEVVIDPNNPKAAMAELRKAEQRARIRMQLAECFNFKQYGSKKQNLNINLNADVGAPDLSKY